MRRPRIRLFPLDRSPGRLLHRANMAMRAGLLRRLRESGFDLSIEEWVVLSSLWDHGEMTQRELGDRVGKDRHYVSRLLDALEEMGLVRRRGTKGDRRINRVRLTAQGNAAETVITESLSDYLDQVFGEFSHEQYEEFLRSLETIIAWHEDQHAKGTGDPVPTVLPRTSGEASLAGRARRKQQGATTSAKPNDGETSNDLEPVRGVFTSRANTSERASQQRAQPGISENRKG